MEQAIYWHVRLLSGNFTSTEMTEFISWQQKNPGNETSLRYVEENWSVLEANKDKIQKGLENKDGGGLSSVRIFRWAGAVAASLIIAATVVFTLNPFAEKHVTAIGEQKIIYLADGSSVSLNTDTALEVDMGKKIRAVSLIKGEAYFQVTPDKDRPFTVKVGQRVIRVVGTEFNIYRAPDKTTLSVTRGIVAILDGSGKDIVDLQLHAGQQVTIDRKNRIQQITRPDLARATAWKEGQLVYENIPLGDFIRDLNRYYVGKIIVEDEELGKMRISGVFQIGDRNKTIKAIENLLPLKAIPLTSNNVALYSEK